MREVKEVDIYVDGEKIIEGLTLNYEPFDMDSEEPQRITALAFLPSDDYFTREKTLEIDFRNGIFAKAKIFESIRLGDARKEIRETEPLIRDSVFVSIDMGAVRHADAPGASTPSPNGFFGDELCQLSRYAGLSEQPSVLGIFELNPSSDTNGQTAHLAAQTAWYFLDGYAHRIPENPFPATLNHTGLGPFLYQIRPVAEFF